MRYRRSCTSSRRTRTHRLGRVRRSSKRARTAATFRTTNWSRCLSSTQSAVRHSACAYSDPTISRARGVSTDDRGPTHADTRPRRSYSESESLPLYVRARPRPPGAPSSRFPKTHCMLISRCPLLPPLLCPPAPARVVPPNWPSPHPWSAPSVHASVDLPGHSAT